MLHEELEVSEGVEGAKRVKKANLGISIRVQLDQAGEVQHIASTAHILVETDRVRDSAVGEPAVQLLDRVTVEEFNQNVDLAENFLHLLDLSVEPTFQDRLFKVGEGLASATVYLSFDSHVVIENIVSSLQKHWNSLIAVEVEEARAIRIEFSLIN